MRMAHGWRIPKIELDKNSYQRIICVFNLSKSFNNLICYLRSRVIHSSPVSILSTGRHSFSANYLTVRFNVSIFHINQEILLLLFFIELEWKISLILLDNSTGWPKQKKSFQLMAHWFVLTGNEAFAHLIAIGI